MKINEIAGHYESAFQLSPEAILAQRMQELKDLAEWRERRKLAYQAWSQPEAIAERKRLHELSAPAALQLGRTLSGVAREQQEQAKRDKPRLKLAGVTVTPVTKSKRLSWWQRLLAWLKA